MTREEVNYTLGSLFDGSGGFPLAGSLCGITPIWASEVEPYPIAVTRSRFPALQHLGDISKINGAEIPPVDIITFGSPCQDLSVAGKRAGLKHESNGDEETTRSGLFMEAVRIIKEMRGATNGRYPSFAVWENVPGAFSSNKGEDFRVVLEELTKIAEPAAAVPPMPQGGWPYADCYVGDGWSVAYRTFDAQYWGVPQRRRRIHLVADFGGERAGKILFEREGVRGYFTQGRTPWQGTSADAESGPGTADREGNCIAFHMLQDPITNTKISPCIGQGNSDHGQASIGICYAAAFKAGQGAKAGGIGWQEKVSPTLAASPSGTNQAPAVCMKYLFENHSQDTRYKGPLDICPMLPAQLGTGGNNTPFVVEGTPVICLQGNVIDRAETARCNGKGWKEDVSYTLNTIDRPAVAFAMQAFGKYAESDTASAMKARDYKDATDLVVESSLTPWDNQARRIYSENGVFPAISAREKAGQNQQAVLTHYIVRRLTPTECARLQGFADRWGDIDQKEDFTEDEHRFWLNVRNTHAAINGKTVKEYTKAQMLTWYNKLHTDSSEYKMWGNGIALPPALYVMQGIENVLRNGTEGRTSHEHDAGRSGHQKL